MFILSYLRIILFHIARKEQLLREKYTKVKLKVCSNKFTKFIKPPHNLFRDVVRV